MKKYTCSDCENENPCILELEAKDSPNIRPDTCPVDRCQANWTSVKGGECSGGQVAKKSRGKKGYNSKKKQFQEHLKTNCGDYNSMVSIAILYKKIYGEFPKIGMSGQQAEFAKSMENIIPIYKTL